MAFRIAKELGGASSAHAQKVSAGLAVFGESDDEEEETRAGRLAVALGEAQLPPAEELRKKEIAFEMHHSKPSAIVKRNSSAFADTPENSDDESGSPGGQGTKPSKLPEGAGEAIQKTMTDDLGQGGTGGTGKRRMSQRLHFSESDIRRMHKLFHQYAPDGKMGPTEFAQYIREQSELKAASGENFEQLFRAYDRNQDGTIVFREYLEFLHGIRFSTSELLDIVFSTFDADSDGFITRDELVKAVTNSTRWKGTLDVEAASTKELIQSEVAKIISFLDTDKDGRVSTHELASAAEAHPEVLSSLRNLV